MRPVDLGYTRHTIGPPGGYQATDPKDVGRVFARDGMRIMSPPQAGLTTVGDVPRLEILATCPGGAAGETAGGLFCTMAPDAVKVPPAPCPPSLASSSSSTTRQPFAYDACERPNATTSSAAAAANVAPPQPPSRPPIQPWSPPPPPVPPGAAEDVLSDGSFEYGAAWNGLAVACGNWKGFPNCVAQVTRVLPHEPPAPSGESVLKVVMGGGYSTMRLKLNGKQKGALCGASSVSLAQKRQGLLLTHNNTFSLNLRLGRGKYVHFIGCER